MPTYDYKCLKCGKLFEVRKKMKDPPRAKCPKCGAKAERQLSGGHGIHFKGTGFYETDYKRAGEKKDGKDGGKDSPGSSASSGSSGSSGSPGSSGSSGSSGSPGSSGSSGSAGSSGSSGSSSAAGPGA